MLESISPEAVEVVEFASAGGVEAGAGRGVAEALAVVLTLLDLMERGTSVEEQARGNSVELRAFFGPAESSDGSSADWAVRFPLPFG